MIFWWRPKVGARKLTNIMQHIIFSVLRSKFARGRKKERFFLGNQTLFQCDASRERQLEKRGRIFRLEERVGSYGCPGERKGCESCERKEFHSFAAQYS